MEILIFRKLIELLLINLYFLRNEIGKSIFATNNALSYEYVEDNVIIKINSK